MRVKSYSINGYYIGSCESVYYSNPTISFGVGQSTFRDVIDGKWEEFKKLSLSVNASSTSSLTALIEQGIATKLYDLTNSNNKFILFKYELNDGKSIGMVIRPSSNFMRMKTFYGDTDKFNSITKYLDDNLQLTSEGEKYFWEIPDGGQSGGTVDNYKNMYFFHMYADYNGDTFFGFVFFTVDLSGATINYNIRYPMTQVYNQHFWDKFGDISYKEYDNEYGKYSESGGYGIGGGSFDNSSDAFGSPQVPSVGVTTTGFINVYNPTLNQLQGFAEDLFPDITSATFDNSGTLEAVANNVKAVGETMKSFADCFINQNLIQYVIDCHIVPCVPSVAESTGLKVGFKTFNYNPSKVTSDYVVVDCGTLNIKEYYKNFLDYVGTKAKLYLPFVGFVDVKNEWFQDGFLKVEYHYNVIDGSFMAFILSTSSKSELKNTVVASYGGNACVHIPITGTNYSSMISGVVQGTSKAISSLAQGKPSGLLEGGMNVLQSRPSVEQSNSYNSNSAFMGVRIPYLIIERPVSSFSENYTLEQGLPLNVTKKLSDVKGFTVCENIITDNLSCTFKEKEMIKNLFKDGVIM